jgi:hypothetical protein
MVFVYYGRKMSLVDTDLGLRRAQVGWILYTWGVGLPLQGLQPWRGEGLRASLLQKQRGQTNGSPTENQNSN